MNLLRSTVFAMFVLAMAPAFAESEPKPIAVVDGHAVYGAQMPAGDAVTIGAALSDMDRYAGKAQKFSGRVTKVCQKKGCWMVLADGETHARVMFGKDDFFIPKDSSGDAVVFGTLSAKEMSEATAKHLAEDEGKDVSKAIETREYQIIATSVML